MVAEISFANAEIYKILCHNARCLISITNEIKSAYRMMSRTVEHYKPRDRASPAGDSLCFLETYLVGAAFGCSQ